MLYRRGEPFGPGYRAITDGSGTGGGLGFGILVLQRGGPLFDAGPQERCFVLLAGRVRLEWEGGSFEAGRRSMVEDQPSSLRLGPSEEVGLTALSETAQLAVFRAQPSPGATPPSALPPLAIDAHDVRTSVVAPIRLKGTADRAIRTILDDSNAPGSGLTLGEVVNSPGRWSSFPPHHHSQVELYHYRFFPEDGFGYSGQGDEVFMVKDGDTVVIPPGLVHPQVAAPGCAMIYLWGIRHLEGDRFRDDSRIYPPEYTWAF